MVAVGCDRGSYDHHCPEMQTSTESRARIEFGDFQTPDDLAQRVCALLHHSRMSPASIIEPTCGKGAFLRAAESVFLECELLRGYEINPSYAAKARINTNRSEIGCEDFFSKDWRSTLDSCTEPILVIGNPPWVTNSTVGAIGGKNLPTKSNLQRLNGFDAMTGKSNFDISEWMLEHLTELLSGRSAVLAMLCKTAVARKVLRHAWNKNLQVERSAIYSIDARKHFGAAVDACLLVCSFEPDAMSKECDVIGGLEAREAESTFGMVDGRMVADLSSYAVYGHIFGVSPLKWRSGIKHDCFRVMELRCAPGDDMYVNGLGEVVKLESRFLYPMVKSSELMSGGDPSRYMLVTQNKIGADTEHIAHEAPMTWRYLESHSDRLAARRSSIYRNQPRFSVFGVGPYSFAPWKVAISGFYNRFDFQLVAPVGQRPVVLDDTSYFLPCQSKEDAETLWRLLNSEEATGLFESLVFWDAKRPITASLLSSLDLAVLALRAGLSLPCWADQEGQPSRPREDRGGD